MNQKNISSTSSGSINVLAEPSLAKCFRFLLQNSVRELHRFQNLPLHVSRSPHYRSPSSILPSRNLYKERDAPFPKPSLTCLTQLSEFPVKKPSLQIPHKKRRHVYRAFLYCLSPHQTSPPPDSKGPLANYVWLHDCNVTQFATMYIYMCVCVCFP